jgi:hypothetical protein
MSLQQSYLGKARYHPDYVSGPHRLIVGVTCRVAEKGTPVTALLDPASEWCVLPPDIAGQVGFGEIPNGSETALHTRFGTIHGYLERIRLWFPADEGEEFELEATGFISADWPGPMVIGWKGCLEWMRFALDPGEDAFYFGAL